MKPSCRLLGLVLAFLALLECGASTLAADRPSMSNSCFAIVYGYLSQESVEELCAVAPNKVRRLFSEPSRELQDLQEHLRQNLRLNEIQFKRAIEAIKDSASSPYRYTKNLIEIAEGYRALDQSSVYKLFNVSDNADRSGSEFRNAMDSAEFDKAITLLKDLAKTTASKPHSDLAGLSEIYSGLGRIEMLRLQYSAAARYFNRAKQLVPDSETAKRLELLETQAIATTKEALDSGDYSIQLEAIQLFRDLQNNLDENEDPEYWLRVHAKLGDAYLLYGFRSNAMGSARLKQAIQAYEYVLKRSTSGTDPIEKARVQLNLATALRELGEREQNRIDLRKSLTAYEESSLIITRESFPITWAFSQERIAKIYRLLAILEKNPALIDKASTAEESAAVIFTEFYYD